VRERKRQTAQIRQAQMPNEPPEPPKGKRGREDVRALEARVQHLEALVQGLQDSVHRESTRHDKRIADLEDRMKPSALGKALSDDARARGL
jgi:hypothetical protein